MKDKAIFFLPRGHVLTVLNTWVDQSGELAVPALCRAIRQVTTKLVRLRYQSSDQAYRCLQVRTPPSDSMAPPFPLPAGLKRVPRRDVSEMLHRASCLAGRHADDVAGRGEGLSLSPSIHWSRFRSQFAGLWSDSLHFSVRERMGWVWR